MSPVPRWLQLQFALLVAILLVAASSGCDKLKGAAPGNYKGEAVAVAERIKADLAGAETVSAGTRKRLDDLIAKYEAEQGQSMSFKNLKDVQGVLILIETKPQMALQLKQSLEAELQKALSALATEGR